MIKIYLLQRLKKLIRIGEVGSLKKGMQRKKNIVYSAIQFMKSFTLFFNEIIKINNIDKIYKENFFTNLYF